MKALATAIALFVLLQLSLPLYGQDTLSIKNMTRKQIKELTHDQLLDLSLEDLLMISNKLGISIDDLLDESITVSSKTALSSRETPGIVTILTAKDIEQMGAEDLADILRTIPGIYFGQDIDGITGIFMRGNWAHEGKVLFIIDDMELNENMYSVTQLLNHIPASQISKLEIVRGPGSALYGGYAELGVIKISTRKGNDINGSEVIGTLGSFGTGINRTSAGLSIGNRRGNSTYSILGSWSGVDLSGGKFTDFNGDTYSMEDGWFNSSNLFLNMNYSYKELQTSIIFDDYSVVPTGYETQNQNRFRNILTQVRYPIRLSSELTITPSIQFKSQTPYWFENPSEEDYWFYKRTANQANTEIGMVWSPSKSMQIISGAGFRFDQAHITQEEQNNIGDTFYNDEFSVSHQNIFAFAQGSYTSKLGNFFGGFRFEHHSITGSNIAPRVGYTKVFNKFNIKYLYSHAFRSPSIENVNLNPDIQIEKTIVNELAMGYRFSSNIYGSINLFDIIINKPIVYTYNASTDEEGYLNESRTGSTGIEVEVKFLFDRWMSGLSYSYYDASLRNTTDVYKVSLATGDMNRVMKGVPAHIINLVSSIKINSKVSLNPILSWYSPRYGYIESPDDQSLAKPYLLADINLLYRDLFLKNLDLNFSLRNILNASYGYIQPWGVAGDAQKPMPGRPFEAILRLKYSIK